jgi:hypothetical protein
MYKYCDYFISCVSCNVVVINSFRNMWVSVCGGCFDNCVGVMVICVLVFTVFCIICTVFLYSFFYIYLLLFV